MADKPVNTDTSTTPKQASPQQGSTDARIVVITGASRGIGYALAKAFGAAGAHVVAVARTVGGLEELDDAIKSEGGSATLVPLDLKDHDAIDRMGLALFERFGKVDVLVGNAGILGPITPVGHIQPKDFDELLSINVTANYRLIRSLDPLLRQSEAGRAVFLTSGRATKALPFWAGYAMSKAALDAIVQTYAAEMINTPVRANLLSPGPIRTAMRARAMPGEDPLSVATADTLVAPVMELADPNFAQTGVNYSVAEGGIVQDNVSRATS